MAKVITFSRTFPSYHYNVGKPTYFVEKIWHSIHTDFAYKASLKTLGLVDISKVFFPKHHTIRAGHRFKPGDYFSPRIWSKKPYNSKQIQFAPDIQVKKTFKFEMDLNGIYSVNGKYLDEDKYKLLALNDGLTENELFHWFMPNFDKLKTFQGQIICWNETIEY